MDDTYTEKRSLLEHIRAIPDPRMENKCRHSLVDIMAITLCAVLCGADDWNAIESFGKSKRHWFEQFLELPNGIPSHDTFRRLFAILSPTTFQAFFTRWVRDISTLVEGVIAIDGKTLRRSHDRQLGRKAIHRVSAWSVENALVLGQVKTEEKSNEITVIPELLKVLSLKGCIITIDAMGCQRNIAQKICEGGGDYVLALKGNQENLSTQVIKAFEQADDAQYQGYEVDYYEASEKKPKPTRISSPLDPEPGSG